MARTTIASALLVVGTLAPVALVLRDALDKPNSVRNTTIPWPSILR